LPEAAAELVKCGSDRLLPARLSSVFIKAFGLDEYQSRLDAERTARPARIAARLVALKEAEAGKSTKLGYPVRLSNPSEIRDEPA
jgi:hypothetical protein